MNDRSISSAIFGTALLVLLTASVGCSSGSAEAGGEETAAESEEGEEEASGTPGQVVLTEAAFATARIEVAAVQTASSSSVGAGGLQVPGQVDFDPARVALISPRTSGRIERLTVTPGARVSAGQTVALITSPAYLTAQSDLLQAARRAELLASTSDEAGARALVSAARRRLQLLGASAADIARIERGGEPSTLLAVPAPFAGSILETLSLAGSAVEAGTPIFRIADLSTILVAAEVPERALGSVRVGENATIRLNAFPARVFSGRVERIADALDPQNRTARALIRVPNTDRSLRPGMFAAVNLDVPAATAAPATVLTIPTSAVVMDGDTRYVFVEVGPRTFQRRAVELAPGGAGDRVVVTSGIAAGERVVVRGAFTLKSELGKAAFGDED